MQHRLAIVACLVFSGLAALVYQVIWIRLLGFAFGTTTEAIGSVLAVFFGGMALGNLLAARRLVGLRRPLRVYAWLELGIGLYALLSLPLLRNLDGLYALVGVEHGALGMLGIRLGAAALLLLPPTIAMGATLPVVARGLVGDDRTLGRWSAFLYTANTLGAVLGAYLCGFWLIPELGLLRSVLLAGGVNLAVAGTVLWAAWRHESPLLETASLPESPELRAEPGATANEDAPARGAFLLFFGISGFVAIGYEIVWSKAFGIVMEGTLYGFSAVLSAYLLGIALGSLAIARFVDRIRDLPRCFALLHVGIAAAVSLGVAAIPYLPFALQRLAAYGGGEDAVHLLFLLVAPIILLPTALFGAAFPVLIRIYTTRASAVGEGMGVATAVNTAGSIAASLAVGFWWIPQIGMDATLYLLILLDLAVAMLVLLRFQSSPIGPRLRATAFGAAVLLGVTLGFGGVGAERAIDGRTFQGGDLALYQRGLDAVDAKRIFLAEGKTSIVTVHESEGLRRLQNNGMPEAGLTLGPPYFSGEAVLLGLLPYLTAEQPERALVIGLGGANTVDALRRTPLRSIEVIELEREVVEAVKVVYAGVDSPLDDPRVELRINDGRNELVLGRHRPERRYDLIASQPSHPWLSGAANLFTEDFFHLVRENLDEGGVFALWVNGFRTDPESVLAIVTSFERVFPGGLMLDAGQANPRQGLVLIGGHRAMELDLEQLAARSQQPGLRALLKLFQIESVEDLLARFEGPTAAFAAIDPDASNTDDNAYVETRIPRRLDWSTLDYAVVEQRLAETAPVLPPARGRIDVAEVARALLKLAERSEAWPYAAKLDRLLRVHGQGIEAPERAELRLEAALRDPARREAAMLQARALARAEPGRPGPLRSLGRSLALHQRDYAAAAKAFAAAYARSRAPQDAYDTARALDPIDPAAAFDWLARIPADARPKFPRIAFYEARRALDRNASRDALRRHYARVIEYRETEDGRRLPGVSALLARLAARLDDRTASRFYADLDARERSLAAAPQLQAARAALQAEHFTEAATALAEALALRPADLAALELKARLALRDRDPAALEEVFEAVRTGAPSLETGIVAENRLRAKLGLRIPPIARPAQQTAATRPAR